jgi:membrane-bound lytic murein transglycosylase D
MRLKVFGYIALFFVFLSFGCGLHKTQVVQTLPDPYPDTPGSATAGGNQENPEAEKLEVSGENLRPDEAAPMEAAPPNAPEKMDGMAADSDGIVGDTSMLDGSGAVPPVSTLSEEVGERVVPIPAEEADASESEEAGRNGQGLLDSALDLINSSQEYWAGEDQDRAIAALDEAYTLVARVETDDKPKLFQQKEDLRYMISKRILEIYASRYTATNGNHNEIPLTLNEYVDKEIKWFQGAGRKSFIESYQRSGRYMPIILRLLKEAGLPEDLAWLPLIESGFRVNALSSARALGLWQFIASTGQKFGLRRDTWIDERLDPEKSTAAAIAYLKELHKIFGDWTTVLAGYNCGEGAVLRKIRNQKINYLDNFWDLFQTLPYETARYVPKFLATLHILKDPAKYGFDLVEPDSPVVYETVTLEKAVRLSAVAAAIAVPEEELSALNPELRYKSTPPDSYTLKVPVGKKDILLAGMDGIPSWSPPTYATHKVRKGESLSVIAHRYGTSVSRIALTNNIREKDIIRVGQVLKVPLRGAPDGPANSASGTKLPPGGRYSVQKGDNLWLIAKKFNTSTKKIQQINGLKDTLLSVGQVLIIPQ